MIAAKNLSKTYRTALQVSGFSGMVRHLVARKYRTIEAASDLTFEIDSGSIVGFLGANGAGKTTTLKMLSGLIAPTGGSVVVGGFEPFKRDKAFLRRITLVMGQKQQLIWDLPALESLKVNAAVYEIPWPEAKRRIGELAELMEIQQRLRQPMRQLSLGERMKCELLAALLHQPDILFLDEPTLGLDINAQESIRQFLRTYNARYGATILLTSHYMADITALCERVLIMHQGRMVYDGALQSIIDRFAPYREVEIQLQQPLAADSLRAFGEVQRLEGLSARLIVRRDRLSQTIAELFERLQPSDLSVQEPPIEDIIGRLLKHGRVDLTDETAAPDESATPMVRSGTGAE